MPLNIYETRVRVHQTDLNAAMYHAAYFDIFDDARIETFRKMGYTYERMRAGGWTAVIRRIECEFYTAALMDEILSVAVDVAELTAATMTLRYECRGGGDVLALADALFALISDAGKPLRVPADLREVIEAHSPAEPSSIGL